MGATQTPANLTAPLQRTFWDCAAGGLDRARNRHAIVLRLLPSGGLDAVVWLGERMSDAELSDAGSRRWWG
jgi:hypothetical protein